MDIALAKPVENLWYARMLQPSQHLGLALESQGRDLLFLGISDTIDHDRYGAAAAKKAKILTQIDLFVCSLAEKLDDAIAIADYRS